MTAPNQQLDTTGGRAAFIDIGRAIAALLVVYTHIDMLWMRENHGLSSPITSAVDIVLTVPLKMDDQGIGQVSVPFFFLVSGFVVTPIALRYGASRFGVNRLFRVYPVLTFVVLVSAMVVWLGGRPLTTGEVGRPDVGDILANISLVNFLVEPQSSLVGVAWTLVVEMIFYATVLMLLPLFRRNVPLAVAVELTAVHVVLVTHDQLGDSYRLFAVNVAYLTIPILGQVMWAAVTRRIPLLLASAYGTAAWLLFVWAANLQIDEKYEPRTLPVAIAVGLFLLGWFAEPHLRQRKVWMVLSDRSYSIYLLHGAVAFPLLHLGYRHLPLWLLVIVALAATAAVVELGYRLVERPSHQLARRLSRGAGQAPPPADWFPSDRFASEHRRGQLSGRVASSRTTTSSAAGSSSDTVPAARLRSTTSSTTTS